MEALAFLFVLAWLAGLAWWIVSIVQVARAPELAYRQTGREKITWVLVVVLLGLLGTLIWWLGPRRDVLRSAGQLAPHEQQPRLAAAGPAAPASPASPATPAVSSPQAPAGWYADPGGSGQRYWDGSGWTTYVG